MLREEQIDLRRQRAVQGGFGIRNLGRKRVFSTYEVTNPASGNHYTVDVRGFDVGDNTCTCPDFRANTLGTCKHIEAVLSELAAKAPARVRGRKAVVTRPEIFLHYGEQLRIGLHLPARCSDQLHGLAAAFFDERNFWKGDADVRYDDLIEAVQQVPEEVTILSDAMSFMEAEIERRELAGRERELLGQLNRAELPLDGLLTVPLYPYQMLGALFAAYRGRCILGDDMGLGKTIQTMAAVELLVRDRGISRVLVVAPASVKYQWQTEIRKFTGRAVQVIDGSTATRKSQYAQPTFYRLINYELVLRDLDALNAWQPDLIVLDEAQRIRNWESKISRAVKKLHSRFAVVLTGTPLENKLEELYSIVEFVDNRRLGPAFQFLSEHRLVDEAGTLLGYRNLDALRAKLEPILLRRTRAEVLGQLPARTETTAYVELSDAQRGPYADQQATLARLAGKKYLSELDRRRILCCLVTMRMLCDSTFLYDKQTTVSPKLAELAEILRDLILEGSHKVVIFSQWEQMLRQTAILLDTLGIAAVMLHGEVPGKDRRTLIDRFRDDPDCRVFLSTDAGGTGLNLQAADTVINLEVPWNPAVLAQRIARVHRLGQHRPVQVINLVTRDSIEERVLQTLERKRSLFDGLFSGTNDEISFGALGQQTFLETVRGLITEHVPVPVMPLESVPTPTGVDLYAVVEMGVRLLEELAGAAAVLPRAAVVTSDPNTSREVVQIPMPTPDQVRRATVALRALLSVLPEQSPADDGSPPVP